MDTKVPVCVHNSDLHGLGVFCRSPLSAGCEVGEVCRTFAFLIPVVTRFGWYINHSKHPSIELVLKDGAWQAVTLFQLEPDTELTLDYNHLPWFLDGPRYWYRQGSSVKGQKVTE